MEVSHEAQKCSSAELFRRGLVTYRRMELWRTGDMHIKRGIFKDGVGWGLFVLSTHLTESLSLDSISLRVAYRTFSLTSSPFPSPSLRVGLHAYLPSSLLSLPPVPSIPPPLSPPSCPSPPSSVPLLLSTPSFTPYILSLPSILPSPILPLPSLLCSPSPLDPLLHSLYSIPPIHPPLPPSCPSPPSSVPLLLSTPSFTPSILSLRSILPSLPPSPSSPSILPSLHPVPHTPPPLLPFSCLPPRSFPWSCYKKSGRGSNMINMINGTINNTTPIEIRNQCCNRSQTSGTNQVGQCKPIIFTFPSLSKDSLLTSDSHAGN